MRAVESAYQLAEAALRPHLPERWLHVQGVAGLAETVAAKLADIDKEALMQAAWLHDIGYSPDVVQCGFHPLDGANYLAAKGVDSRVTALVAHHSAAQVEAQLRDVQIPTGYLDETGATRDALWYCDASTGPRGERWSTARRWHDIRLRYGPDHIVSRFLDEAEPILRGAVERTERRFRDADKR